TDKDRFIVLPGVQVKLKTFNALAIPDIRRQQSLIVASVMTANLHGFFSRQLVCKTQTRRDNIPCSDGSSAMDRSTNSMTLRLESRKIGNRSGAVIEPNAKIQSQLIIQIPRIIHKDSGALDVSAGVIGSLKISIRIIRIAAVVVILHAVCVGVNVIRA